MKNKQDKKNQKKPSGFKMFAKKMTKKELKIKTGK
jgi:hypothetical protein